MTFELHQSFLIVESDCERISVVFFRQFLLKSFLEINIHGYVLFKSLFNLVLNYLNIILWNTTKQFPLVGVEIPPVNLLFRLVQLFPHFFPVKFLRLYQNLIQQPEIVQECLLCYSRLHIKFCSYYIHRLGWVNFWDRRFSNETVWLKPYKEVMSIAFVCSNNTNSYVTWNEKRDQLPQPAYLQRSCSHVIASTE